MVKNPSAVWETWVRSLGWKDPLEEGIETHSSILAWRIPMDKRKLAGYSPWGRKGSDMVHLPWWNLWKPSNEVSPEKGIDAPKEIETKDPIIPKEMKEIEMEKEKEMARLQAALAPKYFRWASWILRSRIHFLLGFHDISLRPYMSPPWFWIVWSLLIFSPKEPSHTSSPRSAIAITVSHCSCLFAVSLSYWALISLETRTSSCSLFMLCIPST